MTKFLTNDVASVFDLNPTEGLFGVEIEIEGRPFVNNPATVIKWQIVRDGSLKGNDSREFVLKTPMSLVDACTAVKELYQDIKSNPISEIQDSMRAGVHIHLNCQTLSIKELMTFLTLYYSLEILLVDRFGEDRVGNLFCLRLIDAEYTSTAIENFLTKKNCVYLNTEAIRYSACNLSSLAKYGSLEFRALKTPTDPKPIINWLVILNKLLSISKSFKDPSYVLNFFSNENYDGLLKEILGEEATPLLLDKGSTTEKILQGIRSIQFWVLTTNWDEK